MTDTPMLLPEASEPVAAQESWGSEFDQVRATVQALQGAATLLQGALEQREGLWAEMRSAEQALSIARAQLERKRRGQELTPLQRPWSAESRHGGAGRMWRFYRPPPRALSS